MISIVVKALPLHQLRTMLVTSILRNISKSLKMNFNIIQLLLIINSIFSMFYFNLNKIKLTYHITVLQYFYTNLFYFRFFSFSYKANIYILKCKIILALILIQQQHLIWFMKTWKCFAKFILIKYHNFLQGKKSFCPSMYFKMSLIKLSLMTFKIFGWFKYSFLLKVVKSLLKRKIMRACVCV